MILPSTEGWEVSVGSSIGAKTAVTKAWSKSVSVTGFRFPLASPSHRKKRKPGLGKAVRVTD